MEPHLPAIPHPAAMDAPTRESTGPAGLLGWLATVDHKQIGLLYIGTATVFFLLGGLEALAMRTQLAVPRAAVLGPETYNRFFTMHGTTMVFLFGVPVLLGFANYFVPLMIGARDMAFPRLNAFSYWTVPFGGFLLYLSFLAGGAPDFGWFAYPPLTEQPYTTHPGPDYWALGLLVISVGTILTAVNLVVTIVKGRAQGMTASRLPVFVWMTLFTALLILGAIPSLTAAQVMLLLDRRVGTHFFNPAAGGDPHLWLHLFWFFGHPEVYILVLPAFGMISEVIPVFSRKPIFGYLFVVGSGAAIAFYSFLTWAHHMFASGLGLLPLGFFGATTAIIAVPTGIKVFSWLATMWRGRLRFTTAMLFATSLIVLFTIGGISGVHFALVPVDWQTTDTYYVVAHLHYVLIGGTLTGTFAGLYYWFPKLSGRLLDEGLGRWHFGLTLIGFNVAFFPMHLLGLLGMPRRVYTYPDLPGWGALNFVQTVGAYVLGASMLILFWNIYRSLRHGAPAGDNPWDATTLEWATSSPPPPHNFAQLPPLPIRGRWPLWQARAPPDDDDRPRHPAPLQTTAGAIDRLPSPVLGMLSFAASELVLFASLILAYLYYRTRSPTGPGPEALEILPAALISLALFASSGTLVVADRRLARDDQSGFRLWLLITILLGLLFLAGQVLEYRRLDAAGVTIGQNLFTSAFYTLTGAHGLHVLGGIVAMGVLAWQAFAGDFRHRRRHAAPQAVAVYWHFVDAVWVAILGVVYLWNLL